MTNATETATTNLPETFLAKGQEYALASDNAKFNGVIALALGYIANAQGWNGRRAAKDPKSWAKIAEAGLLSGGVNAKTAQRWRTMFTKAAQHMGKTCKNTLVAVSMETDAETALALTLAHLQTLGIENFTQLVDWYSPQPKAETDEPQIEETETDAAPETETETDAVTETDAPVDAILAQLETLDAPDLEKIMGRAAELIEAKAKETPVAKAA